MKTPKDIYIVFDPLDGPHLFASRNQAERKIKKWEKDADSYDSVWDMSEIIHFTQVKDIKNNNISSICKEGNK